MSSGHLRVVKRINAGCGWPSVNKLDRSLRVLSGVGGLLHVVIFGELFPLYSNKASASLTSGLRSPPIGDAYQAVIPDERTGPEGAVLFKTVTATLDFGDHSLVYQSSIGHYRNV